MQRGKPLAKEELEELKSRLFVGNTVSRLLATIHEKEQTIERLMQELHYLRSLFEEKRPTKVIKFWLNKSINKFESGKEDDEIDEDLVGTLEDMNTEQESQVIHMDEDDNKEGEVE